MQFDVLPHPIPGAATVLLSSGLGGAAAYWAPQLPALRQQFRVITYDQAGTGRNRQILPDRYSIGDMADEVLAILDATDTSACHFVGHALGGLVGLDLATRAPSRLRSLTAVNAWAKADPHTLRCFEARLTLLQHAGPAAYVRAQPIFLYPATWLAAHEEHLRAEDEHGVTGFQGEDTLRKRIGALLAFDATGALGTITLPTLAIAARDDVLVPATQSERLAAAIPQAVLELTGWGGHSVNVTSPEWFNAALRAFLTAQR